MARRRSRCLVTYIHHKLDIYPLHLYVTNHRRRAPAPCANPLEHINNFYQLGARWRRVDVRWHSANDYIFHIGNIYTLTLCMRMSGSLHRKPSTCYSNVPGALCAGRARRARDAYVYIFHTLKYIHICIVRAPRRSRATRAGTIYIYQYWLDNHQMQPQTCSSSLLH